MIEPLPFEPSAAIRDALAPALSSILACDQASAQSVVDDMQRFLYLCGNTDEPLTPSRTIDAAWHEFLRDGKRYEEFCRSACGRAIAHVPTDVATGLVANRARAEALSWATFGRPLDSIRPLDVADCSNCCSSCSCSVG